MNSQVFALALLAMTIGMEAESDDVTESLEGIRKRHDVPALAAAAVRDGQIFEIGATGLRRAGSDDMVTLDDRWHLGSCTKSMTASLAAMLIEDGILRWDTTVGETLTDIDMPREWKRVTIEQLLQHRGGAPHDPPSELWNAARERVGSPTEQRLAFVEGILSRKRERTPGTRWIYSDSGYAIVGAMIERITGEAWEKLICERLFKPLELKSAGFGEPAAPGEVDQPWGHSGEEAPFVPVDPGPEADNPPAIGPAATVHMSIADFARYAAWQAAEGRDGTGLLSEESFSHLHTSPIEQEYAMGWAVARRRWAGGTALMHSGENGSFFAVMWISPSKNLALVAACNADGYQAEDACDQAIKTLISGL
jgi:CubicO group peptidase (beta-lactamase class C family)